MEIQGTIKINELRKQPNTFPGNESILMLEGILEVTQFSWPFLLREVTCLRRGKLVCFQGPQRAEWESGCGLKLGLQ